MCGIAGFYNFSYSKAESERLIKKISRTLIHRGPDEEGFFVAPKIALGHRRLAIIDLKTGRQPLFNEDKSMVLVYNGEIYNFLELKTELQRAGHFFQTNSDSEVILHAFEEWGENCLLKFNGMFAFALYNQKKHSLFLARDPLGKKPVYYTTLSDKLIFASEPKAILSHPAIKRKLNLGALSKYLSYEYVPAPETIFEGIKKLPAGHLLKLEIKNFKLEIKKYWDLKFSEKKIPLEDAKGEFYQLLYGAVERRLIADVPLGVFLSGGIDSTTIVALMTKLIPAKKIKTFSIGFEEKSFDETKYSSLAAAYFQTKHHHKNFTSQTLLQTLPEILEKLDEPFADASLLPTYLLSKFTRENVTVALAGDGGDELFAGYPTFIAQKLAGYYLRLPIKFREKLLEPFLTRLPTSTANFSFEFKAKQFLKGVNWPEELRFQIWLGAFSPEEQKELFREDLALDYQPNEIYREIKEQIKSKKFPDWLAKISYLYLKFYLQDDILFKTDRAGMLASLEVRAPFLDHGVVDFAAQIPSRYKLKNFQNKFILKQIMNKEMPREIIRRPKKGFGVPLAKWFKKDLKPLLEKEFEEKKIKEEGLFKPEEITRLLNEHWSGKKDNRKKIWTLFVFEKWKERWL